LDKSIWIAKFKNKDLPIFNINNIEDINTINGYIEEYIKISLAAHNCDYIFKMINNESFDFTDYCIIKFNEENTIKFKNLVNKSINILPNTSDRFNGARSILPNTSDRFNGARSILPNASDRFNGARSILPDASDRFNGAHSILPDASDRFNGAHSILPTEFDNKFKNDKSSIDSEFSVDFRDDGVIWTRLTLHDPNHNSGYYRMNSFSSNEISLEELKVTLLNIMYYFPDIVPEDDSGVPYIPTDNNIKIHQQDWVFMQRCQYWRTFNKSYNQKYF
jgi:hypothetical protein